jgi:HPt (histidine-containing phosphotransfer) domain-containing protein
MSGQPIDAATFADLLEMTGGDLAFVDDLVDTYLEEGAGLVAALEAGSAGPADGLVRPAHSLKSSSLNVGALDLGGQCRELEEAARSGPVPDAGERIAAIAAGFAEVRDALLAERRGRSPG